MTRNPRQPAFTIIEMMVVMGIIALLVAVSVPAFSSIMANQNRALALGKLEIGLTAARDLAAQSSEGVDSAAVFFFEPNGRIRIVPCIMVGTFADHMYGFGPDFTEDVEVFVPSPRVESVELPRGWMVRGLAPAGWADFTWYDKTLGQSTTRNWVFPESGFYDHDEPDQGEDRQTFMIRFSGGTGMLNTSNSNKVLVVDPRPSLRNRVQVWGDVPTLVEADDLAQLTRRMLARTDLNQGRLGDEYFGDKASDTVLTKPVPVVALYRESDLAAGVSDTERIRVNKTTGTLYVPEPNGRIEQPKLPAAFTGLGYEALNKWFDGFDGEGEPFDEMLVRYFRVDRYTGKIREMIPDAGGGGTLP